MINVLLFTILHVEAILQSITCSLVCAGKKKKGNCTVREGHFWLQHLLRRRGEGGGGDIKRETKQRERKKWERGNKNLYCIWKSFSSAPLWHYLK